MSILDKALDTAQGTEKIFQRPEFIEGDNVIIIDAPVWKSLIGKSAVIIKNDANPNYGDGYKKLKVDYEDGAVGWFWPHQLRLDNDIDTIEDIVRHLDRLGLSPDNENKPLTMTLETKHLIMIRDLVQLQVVKMKLKI